MKDDLKLPQWDKPLPREKPVSTEAYVQFVLRFLDLMTPEARRRELAKKPPPTGERFSLFPHD